MPKWQFTSYERDSESTLDYAIFRYDNSRLGRFMTPDPIAGSLLDPQSLNRYAYVRNDPVNLVDPLGLGPCISFVRFTPVTRETVGGEGTSGFRNDALLAERVIYCPGLSVADIIALYQKFLEKKLKKLLDFLADNADYLPGVCTAGVFGFGTIGPGSDKAAAGGGILIDKQIGKPTSVEPIVEGGYGPVGVGVTPSETLVFVQPTNLPVGAVFAADPDNRFVNNSGISIGVFAGKSRPTKLGPVPVAAEGGGGVYLTFSSAANCVENF